MYITSAKSEEHRSNISKDILHFVMSSYGTTGDVTSFLTKTWISPEWEAMFQKREHHSSFVPKAFQISFIYFFTS